MRTKIIVSICLGLIIIKAQAQDVQVKNPFGMEFILIQPGSFTVGKFQPFIGDPGVMDIGFGPPGTSIIPNRRKLPDSIYAKARKAAEQSYLPGFNVTIDKAFYIGKYEVTQGQWEKIMGSNPSVFKEEVQDHPVDNITWEAAQAFVTKLSGLDKKHRYRLPTEFEWEYAARAGAKDDISWYEIRQTAVLSGKNPAVIGSKKPNAWGVYDMLGNVWEWTSDFYNEKIFADPVQPSAGKEHVLKGSSFTGDVKNATYMTHAAGPGNGFDIGVRIVMEEK